MVKASIGKHGPAFARLGFCLALAAIDVAAGKALEARAAGIGAVHNIVLVHGAANDGSAWRGVYDILKNDGYHVSVVQEPLTGLSDDVAATQRVIDEQDGPVILVGHSYGGTIITVAGADPKVRALVYVAALQPDIGETTSQLSASMPGDVPANDLKLTKDGFIFIDPSKFAADVGTDTRINLSTSQKASRSVCTLVSSPAAFLTQGGRKERHPCGTRSGDRALRLDACAVES